MSSRRQFLAHSSVAALTALFPRAAHGALSGRQYHALEAALRAFRAEQPCADDPNVAAWVTAAVEAARANGATYVDACYQTRDQERLSRQAIGYGSPIVTRETALWVRALYRGYWGSFAVTEATITLDQAAAAGRAAAEQAKLGARGRERAVELAPLSGVASGTWSTPMDIDPFSVSWDEKNDRMNGWIQCCSVLPFGAQLMPEFGFRRFGQTYASSEGASFAQTLHRTQAGGRILLPGHWRTGVPGMRGLESLVSIAGAGWEYIRQVPFEAGLERLIAQAGDIRLAEPADVGRYDVVFDGAAVARMANAQLGMATELDRAMGYLANRDGTSYLNDPLTMLGTFKVGSPLLTLTANRSMPGGAATVQWDDEGVKPDERTLIKNGVLTDFQTTRESASWLADYYHKTGQAVRSHGGAIRTGVGDAVQQGPSNLVIAPAKEDISFETLCAGVKKGLAVLSVRTSLDQQQLNAESTGEVVYEITNGKLGRPLSGAVFWTRAPEFWQSLTMLGGTKTVCSLGVEVKRQGTPGAVRTVSAPAAVFKQVTVTRNR